MKDREFESKVPQLQSYTVVSLFIHLRSYNKTAPQPWQTRKDMVSVGRYFSIFVSKSDWKTHAKQIISFVPETGCMLCAGMWAWSPDNCFSFLAWIFPK